MNRQSTQNEAVLSKKKRKRGCLITATIVFCFLCLCVTLILTLGIPENEKEQNLSNTALLIQDACNVTKEQAIAIEEILESCEIVSIQEIQHDDMLDDMFNTGDTGYRIQSQGVKNIILYLNSQKEVIVIRHASIDIFAENTCKLKFSAFYLNTSQATKLQIAAQNGVKSTLRTAESAKFPSITDWSFHRDAETNIVTIKSYVDCENLFGAMVRSEFIVLYQITGDIEQGEFSLLYFEFDNQIIVDNR